MTISWVCANNGRSKKLEVLIEHIPRLEQEATIDMISLPMRIKHVLLCILFFCVLPYPRCGSDCLPYILSDCESEEVGPNVTNGRK